MIVNVVLVFGKLTLIKRFPLRGAAGARWAWRVMRARRSVNRTRPSDPLI